MKVCKVGKIELIYGLVTPSGKVDVFTCDKGLAVSHAKYTKTRDDVGYRVVAFKAVRTVRV